MGSTMCRVKQLNRRNLANIIFLDVLHDTVGCFLFRSCGGLHVRQDFILHHTISRLDDT